QARILYAKTLAERLKSAPLQVCPPIAVVVATPVPVEVLRNSRAPQPVVSASKPEIPVFHPLADRLVVAPHAFVSAPADQRAAAHQVRLEEVLALLESSRPKILLGAKPYRPRVGKRRLRIGHEVPETFFDGGRLDQVIVVNEVDVF